MVKVEITGVRFAPRWETLQTVMSEALNREGQFTRISRKDGGVNYQGHGEYVLTFLCDDGDDIQIELTVK